jgi:hypothetical protein
MIESRDVLSLLKPSEVESLGGLPPEAIVGTLNGASGFTTNSTFVSFVHAVIATAGPEDPDLVAAAAAQMDGWVYVIDLRTPGGVRGRVSTEDILGGFEVREGTIVPGSYWQNDEHRPFTERGLMQLPASLREAFVVELRRRRSFTGGEDGQ